ncbi:MAG: spore coat U domain-containing protein [Burkholderiales bacterium]
MKRRAEILAAMMCLASGIAHGACSIAVTPINFGAYNVFATVPLRSTGTFSVTCNEAPPPTVTISIGPSATTGVINPRQMQQSGGSDVLGYNLFTDSALGQLWGDGVSGGTVLRQKVTKNKAWNALVYASLPALQNVSAGSYSDSLLVTIVW